MEYVDLYMHGPLARDHEGWEVHGPPLHARGLGAVRHAGRRAVWEAMAHGGVPPPGRLGLAKAIGVCNFS